MEFWIGFVTQFIINSANKYTVKIEKKEKMKTTYDDNLDINPEKSKYSYQSIFSIISKYDSNDNFNIINSKLVNNKNKINIVISNYLYMISQLIINSHN